MKIIQIFFPFLTKLYYWYHRKSVKNKNTILMVALAFLLGIVSMFGFMVYLGMHRHHRASIQEAK